MAGKEGQGSDFVADGARVSKLDGQAQRTRMVLEERAGGVARLAVGGCVVAVGAASEFVEGLERLDEVGGHGAGGLERHEVHDVALAQGVAVVALLRVDAPLTLHPVERGVVRSAACVEP